MSQADENLAPHDLTGALPGPCPVRARFQENRNAIWFLLPRASRLAALADGQFMTVTFSNGSGGDHVVFQGQATMCDDRERLAALWDSHASIHFPRGPEDPAATLLQFDPHTARFWTGGQDLISFAVNYLQAKITGEPQTAGERGVVSPL